MPNTDDTPAGDELVTEAVPQVHQTVGSSRSTKVPPVTSMANVLLPTVRGPVIATTGLVTMAVASASAILRGT